MNYMNVAIVMAVCFVSGCDRDRKSDEAGRWSKSGGGLSLLNAPNLDEIGRPQRSVDDMRHVDDTLVQLNIPSTGGAVNNIAGTVLPFAPNPGSARPFHSSALSIQTVIFFSNIDDIYLYKNSLDSIGWRWNVDSGFTSISAFEMRFVDEGGTPIRFVPQPGESYFVAEDMRLFGGRASCEGACDANPANITMRFPGGESIKYVRIDRPGSIKYAIDSSYDLRGNRLVSITRNSLGDPTAVVNVYGVEIAKISYPTSGRIEVRDRAGGLHVVSTKNGEILSVVFPDQDMLAFYYNANDPHLISQIRDNEGKFTTYGYYQNGVHRFTVGTDNGRTEIIVGTDTITSRQAQLKYERVEKFENGKLVEVTGFGDIDKATYRWDLKGRLVSTTNGFGMTTEYQYVTSETAPLNPEQDVKISRAGDRLLSTEIQYRPGTPYLSQITTRPTSGPGDPARVNFETNDLGLLTSSVADGVRTSYTYGSNANLKKVEITGVNGQTKAAGTYDWDDEELMVSSETDEYGQVTKYSFGTAPTVGKYINGVTDPMGRQTVLQSINDLGLPTSMVFNAGTPAATTITQSYGPIGELITSSTSVAGNVISEMTATRTRYPNGGTYQKVETESKVLGQTMEKVSYEYDIQQRPSHASRTGPNGQEVVFGDLNNQMRFEGNKDPIPAVEL